MVPKLVCIAGPQRGHEFMLAEGAVRIGRQLDNEISIADPRVSRHHCKILPDGSQFRLIDLESHNGTLVNDLPVRQRVLEHGDEISVGQSVYIALLQEDAVPAPLSIEFDDTKPWVTRRTSGVEGETSPPAESSVAGRQQGERTSRELEALLKINSVLGSVKRLEELEQKLLETVAEVVPADRGAIIMVGDSIEHFNSIFGWERNPEPGVPVEISRAAIDRALRERVAVLSDNVKVGADTASQARGATGPAHSLLAVPLVVFDRIVGVIYLETSDCQVHLDEGHLEWLGAFGRVAAVALENARRAQWLENENRRLRNELDLDHNMVGDSLPIQEVYRFIAKVAPAAATVLIRGESGTGKELVARAIHRNSPRADKPFITLNCAAVAETLLESEMFGHEKGAFTGAVGLKKGRIEVADGGTLFLDEIGELAPNLQAKLLRVLQEREFERVGSAFPIRVDIRVVGATNQDLEKAMKDGQFRADLYYRLNVVSITLPPLRERREDIPLLANYFALKHCKRSNRPVISISAEAQAYLTHYDWPGNVRELENAIERAVVLGSGDAIRPENLPEDLLEIDIPTKNLLPHFHEVVKRTKRELILNALKQTGGNYAEAAKALGLQPTYLFRLVRNLNLRPRIREQLSSQSEPPAPSR